MAREDFFDNINSVINDWKNTGFFSLYKGSLGD